MNEPVSPTTIMEIPDGNSFENLDNDLRTEDILNAARIGFDIVKERLEKETITTADCLSLFFSFDTSNPDFTAIFSLAIVMLVRTKDTINEIEEGTYDKIYNYIVKYYNDNT
jgi:hypothetical protein